MKNIEINTSEFFMWRAVFAFAFADQSLSLEEQELLTSYLKKVPFSSQQREILREDMLNPKSVVELHRHIQRKQDKEKFCILARALVWCEGDITRQEEEILKKVSCFNLKEEQDILHATRGHAHISTYYQDYARSGVLGILQNPHSFELRV